MSNSEIKTNSALDAEKLAGIGPGCWVRHQYRGNGTAEQTVDMWLLVVGTPELGKRMIDASTVSRGEKVEPKLVMLYPGEITAIHRPTDDPRIETAYRLGLPDTVTRAEAADMLRGDDWTQWELGDEGGRFCSVNTDGAMHEIRIGLVGVYFIRSPGGNVWRIVEGEK